MLAVRWCANNGQKTSKQRLKMNGTPAYSDEGKVLSVSYPETWAWSNSGNDLVSTAGPAYTYTFDAMYRPMELKDQNNNMVVNNVSYNAANQLLTFNTETHTYNNLNQMTQLVITGTQPLNISYNFTAGQNNGKIASQTDNLSGETVTYQYDSLNRLITASSSQSWGETYGFDSFGNLLSKTGTGGAPTLSQSVNTANNQIVGQSYDANGNQLAGPLGGVSYDAENRVASAAGGVQYAYDSRNKRVWRSILSGGNLAQQVYVYGVDGQKIGTYTFTLAQYGQTNTPEMTNSTVLLATFFGHKRVGTYDRLGSAKYNQSNNQAQSFYPYGEDRGTVEPNDELKFATYTRDAATGLDYADQRYYASNFGRFMSPDPYRASAGPGDPRSWNRYAYTRGDPVNRIDRRGLEDKDDDEDDCDPDDGGYCVFRITDTEDGGGGGGDESCDDNPYQAACGDPPPDDPTGTDKGGAPVSSSDQTRDLLWLGKGLKAMASFSNPTPTCQKDLTLLGLTAGQVDSIAAGTRLVNINSLTPTQQNQFDPGADLTAAALKNNFIVYNQANFWETTYSVILGALLHEIVHLSNYNKWTDPAIASALSVTITSTDTSPITNKLAKDCFPGATP
jgi:RHS repeat-associated protein